MKKHGFVRTFFNECNYCFIMRFPLFSAGVFQQSVRTQRIFCCYVFESERHNYSLISGGGDLSANALMNCQTSEHRLLKDDEQKVQNEVEKKRINLGKAADKKDASTKIKFKLLVFNALRFCPAVVNDNLQHFKCTWNTACMQLLWS